MTQVSMNTLVERAISGTAIVSFPTDTVPALATLPDRSELIFAAKRRSQDKPLILMAASAEDLWGYVQGSPADFQVWEQVAQSVWPGALTLVLPASAKVPVAMNAIDPTTIGLRVPNCTLARKILQQTGPLATTSANLSGQPPLESMAEIEAQFPEVLTLQPLELPTIATASSLPSTVAKWTGSGWKILRQGAVQLE
ncbi:MAG: Sua5/YciO/YrdC/YwlC family protein [Oscillatoriales cyanobacterium]|uniref:L-threonylcarbamoyladenylate synthase n=1 Tax=Microcoleus anatoxicus PTRS2 TaxID=2705321 RepID=A0ABU8YLH3_9CYAN|nr:MAG: Sua5/YciO/YrdC/YwlC family protein [Oscillatoriales cyanobacterium]TAD98861.1 MAG: Sua5/YciO/YrdC/YwlC family protein [Oscillatoriales cyanobacterium]TAE06878.1 MAG: Sua5/YciO/YrdC/YwlC family protein [Oscillatoriales cyanobacterium]TAE98525.1 MAG: Sua5/YciO/YrdC/YwlC family protein [Oscillatoriales cyanobacterium]TAF39795.1 MAG: Sua5/YciO/YrdC/YwlC family protein [Oscillatoriales cyanobacterium]